MDGSAFATVTDLSPDAFRCVRLAFGYSFAAFAASLGRAPLRPVGSGGGRSGAAFFYSHDHLFVVKSLPEPEKVFLLALLSSYVDHVCTHAAHTLLPRFLGLYKVCA
jgi:ABC-type arginine transport system permease subunit